LRIPSEESEVMSTLQQQKWNPVLDWFNKRFEVDVQWSTELFGLEQPKHTILKMSHVLSGLNKWQLTGLRFSIESLKSFIIPFAVIEKRLSLDDAIFLSRLEIQLQMEKWGNIEWYHETEHAHQLAVLSAGILFYKLCSDIKHIT